MKNLSESFHFFVVKFSVYLDRSVFIMLLFSNEIVKVITLTVTSV